MGLAVNKAVSTPMTSLNTFCAPCKELLTKISHLKSASLPCFTISASQPLVALAAKTNSTLSSAMRWSALG